MAKCVGVREKQSEGCLYVKIFTFYNFTLGHEYLNYLIFTLESHWKESFTTYVNERMNILRFSINDINNVFLNVCYFGLFRCAFLLISFPWDIVTSTHEHSV